MLDCSAQLTVNFETSEIIMGIDENGKHYSTYVYIQWGKVYK